MQLTNAITVDLEEWFHVLYYASQVPRDRWTEYPSRIEATTERTLALFDRAGVKATFFVLGWIAERYPRVVREISSRGHEVASHSHWHRLVHTMTRAEFEADLVESMRAVSAASGQPVRGYRAPSFSLRPDTEWVFDVLVRAGITFDSSILPMNRYYGGIPDASREPHWIRVHGREALREFPVSTCRVLGRNCAFAGAGI